MQKTKNLMKHLLDGIHEDDVAIVSFGFAIWTLYVDVFALGFLAYFSFVPEFREAGAVLPQVLHTMSSLLLLSSSLVLTVRSSHFEPRLRRLWLGLVLTAFLLHCVALLASTAVSGAHIRELDDGVLPVPGSSADVDAVVNAVGKVSIAYNWILFLFMWAVMLFFVSRIYKGRKALKGVAIDEGDGDDVTNDEIAHVADGLSKTTSCSSKKTAEKSKEKS